LLIPAKSSTSYPSGSAVACELTWQFHGKGEVFR